MRDNKMELVRQLDELKRAHGIGGEFGWKSASRNRGNYFLARAFDHVVTASSNKWDVALGHDAGFSERRARCLPLIPLVVRGDLSANA